MDSISFPCDVDFFPSLTDRSPLDIGCLREAQQMLQCLYIFLLLLFSFLLSGIVAMYFRGKKCIYYTLGQIHNECPFTGTQRIQIDCSFSSLLNDNVSSSDLFDVLPLEGRFYFIKEAAVFGILEVLEVF